MSAKKGLLWTLHVMLALVFQVRGLFAAAWLIFGLAVCLPDRWWLWPTGFVSILIIEGIVYVLLNGGPLDPKRLAPDGNFHE